MVMTRSMHRSQYMTPRIDFSKMPKKPVSAPFVFPPTPEQKIQQLEERIKFLENELETWKDQYDSALNTIKTLRERVTNPFKFAPRAPF